jgi:glycosyltransferase involved in cell wall biosynthesis
MSNTALDTTDPDRRRARMVGLEQRWRVVAVLPQQPAVDIVIPVHNDQADLERSVGRLHAYLERDFPFSSRITIADAASTDRTLKIAWRLSGDYPDVRLLRLNESGRGRALAAAWLTSDARVVAQVDCHAPELSGLLPIVAPIISGRIDISIARRLGGLIKALRADVARHLLPTVGNRDWLFDLELALRAERAGFRIHVGPDDRLTQAAKMIHRRVSSV